MAPIIFAHCAVLDGTSRERREDHHVLVEGERIREFSERPIRSRNHTAGYTRSTLAAQNPPSTLVASPAGMRNGRNVVQFTAS